MYRVFVVIAPESKAPVATMGLKVEPGGTCAAIALFINGFAELFSNAE